MYEEEIRQLVEAIGNLNDKYDALMVDFLIFKAKYESNRSKNGMLKEVSNWSEWARQIIVALLTTLAAVCGWKFFMGGIG